jgi:hypothetical protein
MNTNMNLSFNLNFPAILAWARRFAPTLVGLALVGIFGYTGWVVNQAFNVKPDETITTTTSRVVFDKKTVDAVKSLRVIPGEVTPGRLGKADPFGN